MTEIGELLVLPTDSIRRALACIDRRPAIALVVEDDRTLLGTITDGDVRRAMLAGVGLDDPVSAILARKASSPYARPVTAEAGTPPEQLLALMRYHIVRQIPLLRGGKVVDLVTLPELVPGDELPLEAVIMAGGFGTRLRPLTEDVPKPMLPVGGRPLLEHIVAQLEHAGIRHVNVTTHYKPEKIVEHFGDGSAFGVELHYVNEDRPLGSGGALGLMSPPTGPLLVVNGDILTDVDFRAMLRYHDEQQADLTLAVRRYEIQVPYGVVECEGTMVRDLREKPQLGFFVNAGLYLLSPEVFQFIPQGERFNMTDLVDWLLDAGRVVVSFPIREYWMDIGQHADYRQAQIDVREGRVT